MILYLEFESKLFKIISAATTTMRAKLCSNAKKLPNRKYWDPEQNIKANLEKLKSSNEICESIL